MYLLSDLFKPKLNVFLINKYKFYKVYHKKEVHMPKCIVNKAAEELMIEEKEIQLMGKILNNIVKTKGDENLFFTIFQSDLGEDYHLLVPFHHSVLINSCYYLKEKRCSIGVKIYSSPWEDRYKLLWALECTV